MRTQILIWMIIWNILSALKLLNLFSNMLDCSKYFLNLADVFPITFFFINFNDIFGFSKC